jgi:hypothetical protein
MVFRWVVYPALPCRLIDRRRRQILKMVGRLDLLRLNELSRGGRLYPLRDSIPPPPAY